MLGLFRGGFSVSMRTGRMLVVWLGVASSIAATHALAGEWSNGHRISRITVRADRAITVFSGTEAWPNPDACDSNAKIVLLPPGAVGAVESYAEIYAVLLSAFEGNRRVLVFLDGCALSGSETFPRLAEVAILQR
jgi:hypothetical protein